MLNGVDLKSKYPVQPRRKWRGGMMREEMDKERFQIRKNKNDALDSLREFINRENLVYGSPKRLEQLEVVEVILKYIKPDSVDDTADGAQISPSTSPGLPTLVLTPPLTIQDPVQPSVFSPNPGLLPAGPSFPTGSHDQLHKDCESIPTDDADEFRKSSNAVAVSTDCPEHEKSSEDESK